MASQKAMSLCSDLRDSLLRRTTLAVGGISFDTDLAPFFTVGAGTAGSQSILIKVKEIVPVGTDALGLAAVGFTPTVIQCVLETSTIANVALMTEANEVPLLGEILKRATRVELYMSANTVAITVGAIIAGNLKSTFDADLQYRNMSAQ